MTAICRRLIDDLRSMICLDTNVVIAVMNQTSAVVAERFMTEALIAPLGLPAIVFFELHFGVRNSARPVENLRRLATFLDLGLSILDFDAADAEQAGEIRADLKTVGLPIGPYDVLIAAQARRRGATLVTANTREFSRVPGLQLDNWLAG